MAEIYRSDKSYPANLAPGYRRIPMKGATKIELPNMNCWSRPNVAVSVGNSYHMGRMMGTPVSVDILNVV